VTGKSLASWSFPSGHPVRSQHPDESRNAEISFVMTVKPGDDHCFAKRMNDINAEDASKIIRNPRLKHRVPAVGGTH
jgi:hypothetical protein